MICLICRQAETVERLTSVIFERAELKIAIDRVPAFICPNCGEAYVEDDVAIRLLHTADKLAAVGLLDAVGEYESL